MPEQTDQNLPPRWIQKVMNPIMKTILRSPLHGIVSGSLMLITFTGRKTGKSYTTPVSYSRHGETVTFFTATNWWKNLRGGAPVTLRLQGKNVRGRATPTTDPEEVARGVRRFLEENGVENAMRIGLPQLTKLERMPTQEELLRAVQSPQRIVVRVVLQQR